MATLNRIMGSVIGVVAGVIGLVILADVIAENTGTDEPIEDGTIAYTVVDYIVPLMALGLLAGAVAWFRFR